MSVYVDPLQAWPVDMTTNAQARFHARKNGGRWAHLMADTQEELISFAVGKCGLRLAWIRRMNTADVHFDLTPGKHALALARGALLITARQMAELRKGIKPATTDRALL